MLATDFSIFVPTFFNDICTEIICCDSFAILIHFPIMKPTSSAYVSVKLILSLIKQMKRCFLDRVFHLPQNYVTFLRWYIFHRQSRAEEKIDLSEKRPCRKGLMAGGSGFSNCAKKFALNHTDHGSFKSRRRRERGKRRRQYQTKRERGEGFSGAQLNLFFAIVL